MEMNLQVVGICTKAISIAIGQNGVVKIERLIKELVSWSGLSENEIKVALIAGLKLRLDLFNTEAIIPEPQTRTLKGKGLQIKKSEQIDSPEFLVRCEQEFPNQLVKEELVDFVKTFKSKGFATTQQGFLNWLTRKETESQILSTLDCEYCGGAKFVEEFIAGESVQTSCPHCSE
jgi:hypothetical protein